MRGNYWVQFVRSLELLELHFQYQLWLHILTFFTIWIEMIARLVLVIVIAIQSEELCHLSDDSLNASRKYLKLVTLGHTSIVRLNATSYYLNIIISKQ